MQASEQAMTAFAALAFMENQFNFPDNTLLNAMNKAISYLAGAWESAEDPYVLSVVTYALHRADHPQKDAAFRQLDSFKTHSADYGQQWWETQLEGFEKENPWTQMPNSVNIEITSYALMSLLLRNQVLLTGLKLYLGSKLLCALLRNSIPFLPSHLWSAKIKIKKCTDPSTQ